MLIPIGKLADAYELTGQDMVVMAEKLHCQASDSIVRRFLGAKDQRENRIVDRYLNASMRHKSTI